LVGEIKAGRAARVSFVKDLKREVATMREGFRRQNKERARTVMALRQEVAADLAGARRAWFGPTPAERRARAEAERRAKAEAERRAKEAAERDRLAALAMAKEEAIRHHAAQKAKEIKETKPEHKGPAKKK
jgi:colicin import membrane protein